MAVVVRGMMKEQHKAMFAALRAGDLDKLLENVCGPLEAVSPAKPAESVPDPTSKNDLETARVVVGSLVPTSMASSALPSSRQPSSQARPGEPSNLPVPVASAAQVTQPSPAADARAVIDSMKALRDSEEARARRPLSNPNLRKPTPSVAPPVGEAFELDVASLDKNPPPAKPSRTPVAPSVRPPRKSNPAPRKSRPPGPPPRPPAAAPPPPPPSAAADSTNSLGRPQTRLAAAPPSNARSIFGDGAISEQSLDEVILSYLAEDLEEPSK
jgi:hypothetical protein